MIARAFWWMLDVIARWGWFAGAGVMLVSATEQGIAGDVESSSLRIFLATSWTLVGVRDRELFKTKEDRDAYRNQRDRAFDRIRTLDLERRKK